MVWEVSRTQLASEHQWPTWWVVIACFQTTISFFKGPHTKDCHSKNHDYDRFLFPYSNRVSHVNTLIKIPTKVSNNIQKVEIIVLIKRGRKNIQLQSFGTATIDRLQCSPEGIPEYSTFGSNTSNSSTCTVRVITIDAVTEMAGAPGTAVVEAHS